MKTRKLQSRNRGKHGKHTTSIRTVLKRKPQCPVPDVFPVMLLLLVPVVAVSTGDDIHHALRVRTAITDGIVADYSFHGYLYLPGGAPVVGETVWVVNEAETDSLSCVTDDDGRYENDPLTFVPDAYAGMHLRAFPNPDPHTLVFESPNKSKTDIRLFDTRGRNVTKADRIPAGSYVAQAVTMDNQKASVKILFSEPFAPGNLSVEHRMVTTTNNNTKNNPPDASLYARIRINKQGYEPINAPVTLLPEGTAIDPITLVGVGEIPVTYAGDAWGLLDNPLYGGTVFLRNASGTVFSASVDSSWSVSGVISSPSEELEMWFEHPDMSDSGVLFPQGMPVVKYRLGAARNFGSLDDEVIRFQADNQNLALAPESLRYKAVDNEWADNSIWRALLENMYLTRGHHREHKDGKLYIEVLTTQRDWSGGQWMGPASQADIDKMSFVANYRANLMNGGQPDGTVYYDAVARVLEYPEEPWLDKQYISIDPTVGPGNSNYTENGFLEIHFASTPPGEPIGTVAAEAAGENLTDYQGSMAVALEPGTGMFNDLGRAATNAHLLFPHHTEFNGNQFSYPLQGKVMIPEYLTPSNEIDSRVLESLYE